MTRCTINSKNLCIFALRGTCFPSKFSVSAVFLVVKGSHTDLHRFDPRRPYSIKTRIKTISQLGQKARSTPLADHIPLKQGLRQGYSEEEVGSYRSRRPYSIKTRIKTLSHFTAEGKSSLADHIPLKQGLRPGEGGLVRPIRPIPKTSRHLIPILEFSNTDIRDH